MDERDDSPTVEQSAESFAAQVSYWREVHYLSKRGLVRKLSFDPSSVSHMESGRHKPTEDFGRRSEVPLKTGKAVWMNWLDQEAATSRAATAPPALRRPEALEVVLAFPPSSTRRTRGTTPVPVEQYRQTGHQTWAYEP